ncbi:DinB family protein [Nocardioides sp. SYSU DS0651]|uniref:DinB family protein n=1 Tax=Nocardioides sp. SYSU DS0651 TaxID=3415955 RepID=UPI003F4C3AD0
MTTEPAPATEPDTKDWTWVLERPCPDCGLDAASVEPGDLGAAVRANARFWVSALARPEAERRPAPAVWSPTEYACHVRDVHVLFAQRLGQMLTEDDPLFANWDQDETARVQRYDLQRAVDVAPALESAADRVAAIYDSVPPESWSRPGRRSNGSVFTVASLGRYHLHDAVHHQWDVRWMMAG